MTDLSKHILSSAALRHTSGDRFSHCQSATVTDNVLSQLTTFTFPAPKGFLLHVLDYVGLNNVRGNASMTLYAVVYRILASAKGERS